MVLKINDKYISKMGVTERKLLIASRIDEILSLVGGDEEDPNLDGTGERVARAMVEEWFSGYDRELSDVLKVFPNETGAKDLVIVKDIPFFSTCAHHMAPFFGKAAIAYLPEDHVLGLSKFSRVVDHFARRLQLQENITSQVANSLMETLAPKGVMVVLSNVTHMCMESRGVQAHGASTTTSAVRGLFENDSTLRLEALNLLR